MITEENLQSLFGTSWRSILKDGLDLDYFSRLGSHIATLRETKEIYPSKERVFRVFREVPYEKVKVVILTLDPYNDKEDSSDGLAFSNSRSRTISPSLKNIFKEIDDEYPEWKDDIGYGRLDRQDLSRWTKQGVFLLNISLTVEKGKPSSHLELWKPFTTFVLSKLNSKQDLIWMMMGKESQKFKYLVTNPTHRQMWIPHPAAESYRPNAGFFGNSWFRDCNTELEARNKQIIQW